MQAFPSLYQTLQLHLENPFGTSSNTIFLAKPQHSMNFIAHVATMAIPLEYNPLIEVVPSDPDRLPYVPVQVLYLIAQALPQPSQVFNLARVNKATWDYLQPALYECEVTYEARLGARFGNGLFQRWSPLNADYFLRINENDGDDSDGHEEEEGKCRRHCAHGLVTELCAVCGQRIAIGKKHFRTSFARVGPRRVLTQHWATRFFESRGMTALHWACVQGKSAIPVARKAIEAAKAHNPSYIDGRGLQPRLYRHRDSDRSTFLGEIPPPLFTAIAFGNLALCVMLFGAGCNLNLVQAMDSDVMDLPRGVSFDPFFQIHDSCKPTVNVSGTGLPTCQWEDSDLMRPTCKTAGHVALDFGHAEILGYLLDNGLDPLMGKEPLIHRAARRCDLPAVRTLLERYPEMVCHRWDGVTPLHSLCRKGRASGGDSVSLDDLRSVAGYLVEKGASLEAKGRDEIDPSLTPLQFALKVFTQIESNKVNAPVALIMLGANWDLHLSSPRLTAPILIHCVRQATACRSSTYMEKYWRRGKLLKRRPRGLDHAEVIKAMVSNTWRSTSNPAPAQSSERHMETFLDAFATLANNRYPMVLGNEKNSFAIEAVGRLLLSTGIHAGQDNIEIWETMIARNAEGPMADEWAASPWRKLIADLPSAAPAPMP